MDLVDCEGWSRTCVWAKNDPLKRGFKPNLGNLRATSTRASGAPQRRSDDSFRPPGDTSAATEISVTRCLLRNRLPSDCGHLG